MDSIAISVFVVIWVDFDKYKYKCCFWDEQACLTLCSGLPCCCYRIYTVVAHHNIKDFWKGFLILPRPQQSLTNIMVNLNPPCFNHITEALPRWQRNAGQRFYIKYSRLKISRNMNGGWIFHKLFPMNGLLFGNRLTRWWFPMHIINAEWWTGQWLLCINAPIIHPHLHLFVKNMSFEAQLLLAKCKPFFTS